MRLYNPVGIIADRGLPGGGYVLVLVAECFFDESGTHADAINLCVAGYLIEKSRSDAMAVEWKKALAQHGLPYFHMVECAHGIETFAHLVDAPLARTKILIQFMDLIKKYTTLGLAATFNKADHKWLMPPNQRHLDIYALSICQLLHAIREWVQYTGFDGKIFYYFETGHDSQAEAERAIKETFQRANLREQNRYAGHGFVKKEESPQAQAADLLAWQVYNRTLKGIEGKPPRKDFLALMEHPHLLSHWGRKHMLKSAIEAGYEIKLEAALVHEILSMPDDPPPTFEIPRITDTLDDC